MKELFVASKLQAVELIDTEQEKTANMRRFLHFLSTYFLTCSEMDVNFFYTKFKQFQNDKLHLKWLASFLLLSLLALPNSQFKGWFFLFSWISYHY